MKQERTFIGGGMDTDSAIEYIEQRDYISAWNIRNTGTDSQELGYITGIEGTEPIPYTLPIGINKCVGGRVFREFRKAYTFIYNSNQQHLVLEYDFDANSLTKVFENLTDSGGISILSLDPAKYVTDINIVNDTLYFLPSSRIPSRIPITKFKEGTLGVIQEQDIMLIKAKPTSIPTATIISDSIRVANLIDGKVIKLSSQHIYPDNEETVFSEPSIAYSIPNTTNQGVSGVNNAMLVQVAVPDDRVEYLVVAAQINQTVQWSEIKRISREEILGLPSAINLNSDPQVLEAYNNGMYSFIFYNGGLYPAIDTQLTNLEYDRVPLEAEAQELLNGNILAYMNIKEGYENTPVDVNVDVSYTNKIAQSGQSGGDYLRSTGTGFRLISGDKIRQYYNFKGVAKTGDKIRIRDQRTTDGAPSGDYNYTVPPQYNNNTWGALMDMVNNYMPNPFETRPSLNYNPVDGTYQITYEKNRRVPLSSEVTLANQSVDTFTSISALKLNSTRQFGIVYEYPYGRLSGVSTNSRMIASSRSYGFTHGSSPVVTLTINNTPPQGAIGYYIVSSGQLTHQKTTYMVGKYVTGGASDQVVFDVTSLYRFNEDHKNSVVNYSLTEGDRATLLFYDDINPKYFDGSTDQLKERDALVTSFEADEDGGNVTYKLSIQKGNLDTAMLAGKNILIEVYTPKKQSDTNNLFYTIGKRYDIINGQHSVNTIIIDRGEVYIKTRQYRNPQDYNDFNEYVVEDFNYSDFEDTAITDLGRPYLYNKNFKRLELKSHIRYSDVFNQSTGFNQLNRFKSENIYGNNSGETAEKYGEGMKMRQRGSSLIIFQELEVGYIPVNTTIYEDVTGQSNVAVSDKLLNNIRYNGQGIGIGKAVKSFAENDGEYYFVDPNKSQPVKVDRGGVRFITGKMSKFFQTLLQSVTTSKRDIIGFYNDFYREYTLSVESENGVVVSIPMNKSDWDTDNYTVTPDQITISQPNNGTLTYDNTTGIATYTPDEDYLGGDVFQFSFGSVIRNKCLNVVRAPYIGKWVVDDTASYCEQTSLPAKWVIDDTQSYCETELTDRYIVVDGLSGNAIFTDNNTKWGLKLSAQEIPVASDVTGLFNIVDINDNIYGTMSVTILEGNSEGTATGDVTNPSGTNLYFSFVSLTPESDDVYRYIYAGQP